MAGKKGFQLLRNMILGVVLLAAFTIFVTSDIGGPFIDSITNFMFPEFSSGCDTNSINSIRALAYALNCTGMHHAGISVSDICPPQKMFGSKMAVCYGSDEDYHCDVEGFELTKNPEYNNDPESWITGMGDPNCIVYYEAFPEEQAADWKIRVEDLSLVTVAIGGAFNIVPVAGQVGGKAVKKVGKEITKGIKKALEKRGGRLYEMAAKAETKIKDVEEKIVKGIADRKTSIKNTITFRAFRDKMFAKKMFNNIYNINDRYLAKEVGITDDIAIKELGEAITKANVEAMQTTGSKTTQEWLDKLMRDYIDLDTWARFGTANQKALVNYNLNMIQYVMKKETKLEMLKRISLWNHFDDIIMREYTPEAIKELTRKGAKIWKHLTQTQKEKIAKETDTLARRWVNAIDVSNSKTAKLWAMDMVTDNLDDEGWGEYGDEANALGTCAIMHKGKMMASTACAFFTSAGIMAAYIDNDNEKYDPVGINSLGYKKNYYGVETEKLADVVNFYYVALKRDEFQDNTRFFLASPCKTDKVVVKHEKMGCYYTECHDEAVCCQRKEYNYATGTYEDAYVEWAAESSCQDFKYVGAVLHNTGEVLKRGFLFTGKIAGGVAVLYADVTGNDDLQETGEDWSGGVINVGSHTFVIEEDEFRYATDESSYPEKLDDSVCEAKNRLPEDHEEYLELKSDYNTCKGAYFAVKTTPELLNLPIIPVPIIWGDVTSGYFFTDNPLITTVGTNEGIYTDYRPEGESEWSSLVEIRFPETYYHTGFADKVRGDEINIQARTASDYNNDDTTDVSPAFLFMGAEGNGVKQCLQLSQRMGIIINPWAHDMKTDIDVLTVDVEKDKSFEGTNYCYAGTDWEAAIEKTAIMGVLLGLEAGFGLATGGVGLAPAMFVSGMLYEGASHYIDKANAWPHP